MARSMTPIGVIADLVCDENGDTNHHLKFRIEQYIVLGFQKMHLFLNPDVSVKSFIIPFDYIVEMPSDFVYETKVGVIRNGRAFTLWMNHRYRSSQQRMLNDSETLSCMDAVHHGSDLEDDCYFHNCFRGSDFIGPIRSYGSGYTNSHFYNIKKMEGIIELSPSLPKDCEVVVEYKSDGISAGLKLVPSEAFLALKYYATARLKGEGENGTNETMFRTEWATLKRLYNFKPIDLEIELIR